MHDRGGHLAGGGDHEVDLDLALLEAAAEEDAEGKTRELGILQTRPETHVTIVEEDVHSDSFETGDAQDSWAGFSAPTIEIEAVDADREEGDGGAPTAFTFRFVPQGWWTGQTVDWEVSGDVDAADFVGGEVPSGTFEWTHPDPPFGLPANGAQYTEISELASAT